MASSPFTTPPTESSTMPPVAAPPTESPTMPPVAAPPTESPTMPPVTTPPTESPLMPPVTTPPSESPSPPLSENPPPSHSSLKTAIIGAAVGGVLGFFLLTLFAYLYVKRKKKNSLPLTSHRENEHQQSKSSPPGEGAVAAVSTNPINKPERTLLDHYSGSVPSVSSSFLSSSDGPQQPRPPLRTTSKVSSLSYKEIAAATQDFATANFLGQGGFGNVHRGVLLDGTVVAVKQLRAGSGQGEHEFQTEVEIISRVHHRHLVSLVGYCIHEEKRLLVYEFVPNSTLDFHLHGKGKPTLQWSSRLKIAIGAAKGLAYLHEDCIPKIIHRDIKATNILLGVNFEAKVADFGLAKLTTGADQTHISTRVMGTFGYLAPEYASTGKLTEKSDVFSYGVMLLELITGRRPVLLMQSELVESLVDLARPLLPEALMNNDYRSIADPRLEQNYDLDEMKRMVACAAACVRHSAQKRPKMGQVVRVLDGGVSMEELNCGVTPGHSILFNATANFSG